MENSEIEKQILKIILIETLENLSGEQVRQCIKNAYNLAIETMAKEALEDSTILDKQSIINLADKLKI